MNWQMLLVPSLPVSETVFRGTAVYLSLFALFRLVLKREAGTVGIPDLLMVVLVGNAVENALADQYRSIVDGLILVLTILFWNFVLDWLGFRSPLFRRLLHPQPLLLIKDGWMMRGNMRRELISEDELMSELRQQGVDDPGLVKEAYMEGDGTISVVRWGREPHRRKARPPAG